MTVIINVMFILIMMIMVVVMTVTMMTTKTQHKSLRLASVQREREECALKHLNSSSFNVLLSLYSKTRHNAANRNRK